jgi:hypothetical protein
LKRKLLWCSGCIIQPSLASLPFAYTLEGINETKDPKKKKLILLGVEGPKIMWRHSIGMLTSKLVPLLVPACQITLLFSCISTLRKDHYGVFTQARCPTINFCLFYLIKFKATCAFLFLIADVRWRSRVLSSIFKIAFRAVRIRVASYVQ